MGFPLDTIHSGQAERIDSFQPHDGPQYDQQPPRKNRKISERALKWIVAGVLAALLPFLVLYFRLAARVDARLADGPFADSMDILTAPEALFPGEEISREELMQKLLQSGYSQMPGNPAGSFEVRPATVKILPGSQTLESNGSVMVTFANGRISSIRSLADNRPIQEYRIDPELMTNLSPDRESRRLVRFNDIPKPLLNAVISAEDKRFFQHGGYDLVRAVKAAYVDLRDGRKSEGASTLTMQLARNMWLDRGKSWRRKLEEALITGYLEDKLTKQEIFEDYANEVYLGQRGAFSIHGFGEAAHVFFGKSLSQLTTADDALLAGLIRRPSYYNPLQYPERARQRRDVVLGLMLRNGMLTDTEYQAAIQSPLRITPEPAREQANAWFLGLLRHEMDARLHDESAPNRVVYSTIEPELQQAAQAAVRSGMQFVHAQLRGRPNIPTDQPQVALIALDPRTGEIKALVGGSDYDASELNHVLAMRQPGSVFKPFVYAAALSTAIEGGRKVFTPASVVNDEATTFYDPSGPYQPHDFHDNYMGQVTLRTALSHSLNVAAVTLAQQVGYANVVAMARRAGLNEYIRPTPAVALGAYEVTPLEIAGAYTMFANQGLLVRPTTISMVRSRGGKVLYRHDPDATPVLDPRVAYLMVSMLEDVLRSGTGAAVRSRGFTLPAAGKTGTSRDGWFAGFTDRLLCVVWVGFDDNRDLNLEGSKSALPIWAEFMRRASALPEYASAREFSRPPGVVSVEICSDSGELAGPYCPNVRNEVFIDGTQPQMECELHRDVIPDTPDGGADREAPPRAGTGGATPDHDLQRH